ncbi:MAG: porin family protein [Dysgonamonadaceae bacterium]|jgi:hypothetical protein|nr:porin family protein [Dysgonamonadaceae bacterium]
MNKSIPITVCLCFLVILPVHSIRWGIKAGVNLSEASFSCETLNSGNFTGFQAGPVIEFSSITGFGLNMAVLYSQQGFKLDRKTIQTKSINVPLNLKYKIGLGDFLGIYGTAGPYAGFKISGDHFSIAKITEQIRYKTFGAGLNFGFGFEIFRHLQVGANYQLALTDDYSSKYYDLKTKTWSVTASYFF